MQRPRWCPKCKERRPWTKVRPPGARCSIRACGECGSSTRPRLPGRKKQRSATTLLREKADDLWRAIIRRSNGGRCKLQGQDHVRCGGPIQAAHCFTRNAHGVRHALWNGWPLCAGHHIYYTGNQVEWEALLRQAWGDEVYDRRFTEAHQIARPDYAAVVEELTVVCKEVL